MTRTILLSALTLDAGTKVREVDWHVAAAYAALLMVEIELPPITVYHVGEEFLPTDGFHRIKAVEINHGKTIACEIIKGSRWEAMQAACAANWKHGQPRTNADKHKAVLALLGEPQGKDLSNRDVAAICKVSHTFVAEVRKSTGNVATWQNGQETTCVDGKKRRKLATKPKKPALRIVEGNEPEAAAVASDVPPFLQPHDDDLPDAVLANPKAANGKPAAIPTVGMESGSDAKQNGKPRFDDRIVENLIGKLARALDDRAEAYGGQGPRHAACLSSLNEFKADWTAWQKAGVAR